MEGQDVYPAGYRGAGLSAPPSAQAACGAVGFAAQVGQRGGILTVSLTLPQPLRAGAASFKTSGSTFASLPARVVENRVTYRVQDGEFLRRRRGGERGCRGSVRGDGPPGWWWP